MLIINYCHHSFFLYRFPLQSKPMFEDVLLIYSDHAQARLVDRGVFKKQVRRTLRRPDTCRSQGQNQLAEYVTSTDVVIRVVYRPIHEAPGSPLHVVTVIRLGKLKRASQNAPVKAVYDRTFDVAYIGLLNGRISETVEVSDGIYYDLDSYGEIVGVEIFNYSRYQAGDEKTLSIFERLPVPT